MKNPTKALLISVCVRMCFLHIPQSTHVAQRMRLTIITIIIIIKSLIVQIKRKTLKRREGCFVVNIIVYLNIINAFALPFRIVKFRKFFRWKFLKNTHKYFSATTKDGMRIHVWVLLMHKRHKRVLIVHA